jgi:hypothetical protein
LYKSKLTSTHVDNLSVRTGGSGDVLIGVNGKRE